MPEAAQNATSTPSGATPGSFIDPYPAYNFKLEMGGVTEGHFTHCSGLVIDIHPIRYREGGAGQVVHAIPGPVTYEDVVLHFGLTSSTELWTWLMSAVPPRTVERRNVSVLVLDRAGTSEVVRWNLVNAWPRHWRGAVLDALSREVAIERLTLTFDTLERG